jgi:hypothetical protein
MCPTLTSTSPTTCSVERLNGKHASGRGLHARLMPPHSRHVSLPCPCLPEVDTELPTPPLHSPSLSRLSPSCCCPRRLPWPPWLISRAHDHAIVLTNWLGCRPSRAHNRVYLASLPPSHVRAAANFHLESPPSAWPHRTTALMWPSHLGSPRAEPIGPMDMCGLTGARAAFLLSLPLTTLTCRGWSRPPLHAHVARGPRATSAHAASACGCASQPRS